MVRISLCRSGSTWLRLTARRGQEPANDRDLYKGRSASRALGRVVGRARCRRVVEEAGEGRAALEQVIPSPWRDRCRTTASPLLAHAALQLSDSGALTSTSRTARRRFSTLATGDQALDLRRGVNGAGTSLRRQRQDDRLAAPCGGVRQRYVSHDEELGRQTWTRRAASTSLGSRFHLVSLSASAVHASACEDPSIIDRIRLGVLACPIARVISVLAAHSPARPKSDIIAHMNPNIAQVSVFPLARTSTVVSSPSIR